MSLPGTPVNSETFLPPASCKHKTGDEDFLKGQNADRERTVCAIGLDVHYELNVVANESGANEPRLKPFNPRMSGPACPYNYTGKFVKEAVHSAHQGDPIELGRAIAKEDTIDPALYSKRDPRLVSKTVVVRDYGCKIPIDVADTEKIARAVLNHYPDQYVSFLGEFVSNLFGPSMRKFLDKQIAGYQKLLDHPDDLNRMSWGSYMSVQGKVTQYADGGTYGQDVTLPYFDGFHNLKNMAVNLSGASTIASTSATDVYDVTTCLQEHIQTMKDMQSWCRGFGSNEVHVLAMLYYANEQGRNLCSDLRLMTKSDTPDYDLIHLFVPHHLGQKSEPKLTSPIQNPDQSTSIHSRLQEPSKQVEQILTSYHSVGSWSGSANTSSVFLNTTHSANYGWGWGHPGNLYYINASKSDPPYKNEKHSLAFVLQNKWTKTMRESPNKIIPAAEKREGHSLRDSLDVYQGTNRFRSVEAFPTTLPEPPSTDLKAREELPITPGCDTTQNKTRFSVLRKDLVKNACDSLDPFVRNGRDCFDADGTFPASVLALYSFDDLMKTMWKDNMSSSTDGNIWAGGGDHAKLKKAFEICHKDAKFPYHLLLPRFTGHELSTPMTDKTFDQTKWDDFKTRATVIQDLSDVKLEGRIHVDMSDVQATRAQKLALQIYLVRKIIQYSMGPHAAHVVCSGALHLDPFQVFSNKGKAQNAETYYKAYCDVNEINCVVELKDEHGKEVTDATTAFHLTFNGSNTAELFLDLALSRMLSVLDTLLFGPLVERRRVCSYASKQLNTTALTPLSYTSLIGDMDIKGLSNPTYMFTYFHENPLTNLTANKGTWQYTDVEGFPVTSDIENEREPCRQLHVQVEKEVQAGRAMPGLEGLLRSILKLRGSLDFSPKKEALSRGTVYRAAPPDVNTEKIEGHIKNIRDAISGADLGSLNTSLINTNIEQISIALQSTSIPFNTAELQLTESDTPSSVKVTTLERALRNVEEQIGLVDDASSVDTRSDADGIRREIAKLLEAAEALDSETRGKLEELERKIDAIESRGPTDSSEVTAGLQRSLDSIRRSLEVATQRQLGVAPVTGRPPTKDAGKHVLYPIDKSPDDASKFKTDINTTLFNENKRAQLFAMLDAAGILWNARAFYNPADANRPEYKETDQPDDMHYWCRYLVESFVVSRERFKQRHPDELWEHTVKQTPADALPSSLIGELTDDTFRRLFPLLPNNHDLRTHLKRVRALGVMWGELRAYSPTLGGSVKSGAWMPVSAAHRAKLLETVGLYDHKYRVPSNPWLAHNGEGISRVYNQSYHSVYHTDSWKAPHFREWVKFACRYQPPSGNCKYPFSQYGGTPVEGDFLPHRVERPAAPAFAKRHAELVYNRFGFTGPLRIGQQFEDTGLLQDLFQFEYRPFAKLSQDQRAMPAAEAVYPSNFLAYARTHAIVALASCNQGTQEASVPRIVRNLYRLYVDTYKCMGANPDDDGVPVVMGFLPHAVHRPEDRPVVLYAGSLACLNTKLERFCASATNRGERVCQMYKQVYLNDATLLFTRLLRAERRRALHDTNFENAAFRRGTAYTRQRFDQDLIELQDAYIDFLQTTVLGMLIESGADLNDVPLHLLEPRELEVSMAEEDTDVVGNDFLTPATRELVKGMDFGGDTLNRTQLAILSLIPPNNRVLGTLRLNQSTQVLDLEHVKKQIQKDTIEGNKKVWNKYLEAMVSGSFAARYLEQHGPVDFGFDMSAIKDPLKESEGIRDKLSTTHAQSSSTLSQSVRGDLMRQERGPQSVLGMNTADLQMALQRVRDEVELDYARHKGRRARVKCLDMLRIPEHVKRILRPEYEN